MFTRLLAMAIPERWRQRALALYIYMHPNIFLMSIY